MYVCMSSKGISSLATKSRQLKMFDVAMTKVRNNSMECYNRVVSLLKSSF